MHPLSREGLLNSAVYFFADELVIEIIRIVYGNTVHTRKKKKKKKEHLL